MALRSGALNLARSTEITNGLHARKESFKLDIKCVLRLLNVVQKVDQVALFQHYRALQESVSKSFLNTTSEAMKLESSLTIPVIF